MHPLPTRRKDRPGKLSAPRRVPQAQRERVSAYKRALIVDDTASEQRLVEAAKMLEGCEGVVMLPGVVALRPTPSAILCEVIDPIPGAHRCAEE
jgi:hypothetical protein